MIEPIALSLSGGGGFLLSAEQLELQALLDRRRQPSPVGLAGRDSGGRLHHQSHLLHAGPLAELLGNLCDRGVGDICQLGLGEGCGEVLVDDPRLGVLLGGELAATVLGVDLGRFAALS